MKLPRMLPAAVLALFAAGCTSAPLALPADHPASAQGSEAPLPSTRSRLTADANTLRTRDQLDHPPAEDQGAPAMPMEGHEHH